MYYNKIGTHIIISNGIIDQKPKNVNKFWMLYHDAVIGSGILEKTAEWYMNWAQGFGLSMKGKKLRSRSKDINTFLSCLEVQKGLSRDDLPTSAPVTGSPL